MKITLKSGLIFAFAWILIKLSVFGMGISSEASYAPMIFANMLFMILAITVGLYLQKRKETEDGNTLSDIKNSMIAGVPYAIIISVFIYFYYSKIDPEFCKHKIAETEIELNKTMEDPIKYKQLRDSNASYEVMTDKQLKKSIMDNSKSISNPKSHGIMAIQGLLFYATINSIFITVIMRKIVFRKRK